MQLPAAPPDRAALSVLDVSEYVNETSGGVRTYLLAKADYVAARPGLRQVMVIPAGEDDVTELRGGRCYRLRGPTIPFQPSYRFLTATASVRRIIAHERPDIIEIGSSYFVPWVVARARGRLDVPVVWFYHSNLPRIVAPNQERDGASRRTASAAIRRYVKHVGRRADATLVASDFVARDLERWGVSGVERVALGVDADRFHPSRRAARDAVRADLGIDDGPLVTFMGRYSKEKRADLVLRAWPAIERRTGGTLVLVGHGPQERKLRALAEGQRVRFMSFQSDRDRVADLLAASDLFISASPNETFGLAVCEALASGTPVLSAAAGATAELVLAARAGSCFPVDDPVLLAEAAVALLDEDRARLGARGRAYVEANHTWTTVLDRLFAVYERLRR